MDIPFIVDEVPIEFRRYFAIRATWRPSAGLRSTTLRGLERDDRTGETRSRGTGRWRIVFAREMGESRRARPAGTPGTLCGD